MNIVNNCILGRKSCRRIPESLVRHQRGQRRHRRLPSSVVFERRNRRFGHALPSGMTRHILSMTLFNET